MGKVRRSASLQTNMFPEWSVEVAANKVHMVTQWEEQNSPTEAKTINPGLSTAQDNCAWFKEIRTGRGIFPQFQNDYRLSQIFLQHGHTAYAVWRE